jgi:hypothetical protein
VLDWLNTRTELRAFMSSPPCLQLALNWAGNEGQLAAMQWLRSHGAPWPHNIFGGATGRVRKYWSVDALRFAFAAGCQWTGVQWDCAKVVPLLDTAECTADAVAVLQWAHTNGCPCTCPRA